MYMYQPYCVFVETFCGRWREGGGGVQKQDSTCECPISCVIGVPGEVQDVGIKLRSVAGAAVKEGLDLGL